MDPAPITLESTDHPATTGHADEVARHSAIARIGVASVYVIGGFLLAVPCIIVPVVHLVSTWGLPLLGILMAVRTWKREIVIYRARGKCPACHQPIELNGGSTHDATWQVCPKCKSTLTVRPV